MHAKNPLFSVIIPIYNMQEYLEECIDSVCAQTYTDIQIILVNDGSTDRSASICDQYRKTDDRIVVINKKNAGLVSARKAGVRVANGKYLSFVDGDDWIDAETFERIVPYLSESVQPDVIAYGCIEEYMDHKSYKINEISEGIYEGERLDKLKQNILMGENFFSWRVLPHLCDKVIRKALLEEHINNVSDKISFGEDAAISFPCMIKACSICSLNITPYHYRQREGSIVKGVKELENSNFKNCFKVLRSAFEGSRQLEEQLKYYMFFMLCLKAYSRIESGMPLFPFERVREGSRVFVYGAGGFGKVIERYLRSSNHLKLAGWADRRAEYYQNQGYKVDLCESVYESDYEYIVIAILDEKMAGQIRDDFVQRGIPDDKIDYVKGDVIRRQILPGWVGNFA